MSPTRAATLTFVAVVAFGLVAGIIAFTVNDLGDPYARGQRLGQGLATFGIVCAGIAYVVQRARLSRR